MALNLANRHAAGVERDDLVVKAAPAGLVFGDQLGFEGAMAVARHLDGQLTELTLERFAPLAVAGIAAGIDDRLMLRMAQMLGKLGIQRLLYQQLS
jgi:hypothetical protein